MKETRSKVRRSEPKAYEGGSLPHGTTKNLHQYFDVNFQNTDEYLVAPPHYNYTEDFEVPRGKAYLALFYGAVFCQLADYGGFCLQEDET